MVWEVLLGTLLAVPLTIGIMAGGVWVAGWLIEDGLKEIDDILKDFSKESRQVSPAFSITVSKHFCLFVRNE